MQNKILELKNFSKTYPGGKRAVDGLSLDICAGDIYGFIGQNGAGKTTTLRAVSGILQGFLSFSVSHWRVGFHAEKELIWQKKKF